MPHDVTPVPSDEAQDVLAVGRSDVTCTAPSLLLAAPFETVTPYAWDKAVP